MNPDFVIKDSVLKQYKGAGGDVVIPDGVTELDFESFRFCEGLETVTIPQSVTAISQGVFSNCTNLTSATVPGSVKTIGFAAFRFCESLTSVVISDGVEELGGNTFFGCHALKTVVIPGSVKKLWDGPLGDFEGCEAVTVVCPEGSYAHKFCKENHMHFIFDYQYTTYGGLAPKRIEKITSPFQADEEKPFIFISYSHKDSERIFVIIKRLYEAGWKIWYDEGLTIGDSYDKEIERHVAECSVFLLFVTENSQNSKYIDINEVPWGVKYKKPIIKCILDEGTDIPVVGKIPLVTIELDEVDEALENIDGLIKGEERVAKGIVVSVNPQNRQVNSFFGNPNTAQEKEKQYAYCLYSQAGANRAKSILYDARESGCRIYDSILEGEDPDLLRKSPCLIVFLDNAFLQDTRLVKILTDAFDQKRDLAICRIESITLPDQLKELKKIHWLNYSHNEDDIMNAHLASHLQKRGCRSEDVLPGFSYETTGSGIIITEYHGSGSHPVIESEYNGKKVVCIDTGAFKDCKSLKSVTLPNSVKRLGENVFEGCTELEEVVLSDRIDWISTNAFFGCTALSRVKLPKNLKLIGDYAFEGCTALTSIEFPEKLLGIGYRSFCECTSLNSISLPDSMKKIDEWAFMNCTGLASLDLGKGINEIGWGAFDGCEALQSLVIPSSVAVTYGFSHCEGLTEVRFLYGVETIGAVSFTGCKKLNNVIIPKSVSAINGCAFKDCDSLTEITIPASVKTIDPVAFENCSNLTVICSEGSAAHRFCEENGIKVKLDSSSLTAEDENVDRTGRRKPDSRSDQNQSGEEKVGFFGRLFKKKKKKDDSSKQSSSKQVPPKKHKMSEEEKYKAMFYRLTAELFEKGLFKKVIELKGDLGCVVNACNSVYLLFSYVYAAGNDREEIIGMIIPKSRITKAADDMFSFYQYVYDYLDDCQKICLSDRMIVFLVKKKQYTDQNGPDLENVDPDADKKLIELLKD